MVVDRLESEVIAALKARARRNGRGPGEELRDLLRKAVAEDLWNYGLGTAIASRFRECGFKEGEIQELRGFAIRPATFDGDI